MNEKTRKLFQAVTDDIYDHLLDVDEEWFDINIGNPVRELICQLDGHEIVDDQCGKPEHRYCVVCMRQEPTLNMKGNE